MTLNFPKMATFSAIEVLNISITLPVLLVRSFSRVDRKINYQWLGYIFKIIVRTYPAIANHGKKYSIALVYPCIKFDHSTLNILVFLHTYNSKSSHCHRFKNQLSKMYTYDIPGYSFFKMYSIVLGHILKRSPITLPHVKMK